jgi:hypothetical protein
MTSTEYRRYGNGDLADMPESARFVDRQERRWYRIYNVIGEPHVWTVIGRADIPARSDAQLAKMLLQRLV